MKIAIVNPHALYIQGGAELCDNQLGQALRDLGHEVIFLSAFDTKKEPIVANHKQFEKIFMSYWYPFAQSQAGIYGKILRHLFEKLFLIKLRDQKINFLNDQDVILLTGRALLSRIAKSTKTQVLQSIHGVSNRRYWPHYYLANGVIFWGGCKADHPTKLRDSILGLELEAAIEKELFHPGALNPELQLTIQNGEPSCHPLIYVGRLDPEKQISGLILAVSQLLKDGLKIRLLIIGDGSIKSELQDISATQCPPDSIYFHGHADRQEIAQLLRASDVFVLNSRTECDPISVKEAVACGTYVVAPNLGRIAKSISATGFGQTFTANDQKALEAALKDTLQNGKYQKKTHSQRFHTWQDNARQLLNFISQTNKYEI